MTFEQKLATLIGAAIAIAALVECLIVLAHRSNRGTTTYWYRGQQITRHDYAAIKAAEMPADEWGDPVGAVCRARLAPFFSAWDEPVER